MSLKTITFKLKAPFAEIGGEWAVEQAEQKAAWEMYVELATRVEPSHADFADSACCCRCGVIAQKGQGGVLVDA